MSLNRIDRESVHRICSNQVIVDLATSVKELIENSLDAGATSIEIRFKEQGIESIEVIDNGCGIKAEDHDSLALAHHTSKLSTFSDLANVTSYGFRGEALSALAGLSNLVVTTRTKDMDVGWKLEFEKNGRIRNKSRVAIQPGTSISVQRLFESLPVRSKEFKKNIKREFTKCLNLIQSYALISIGVKISVLTQGSKGEKSKPLATNANKTVRENTSNIFGAKFVQQMMPVEIQLDMSQSGSIANAGSEFESESHSQDSVRSSEEVLPILEETQLRKHPVIVGMISKPDWNHGRSSSDRQFFFVNGRPCDLPKVAKMINEVYRTYNTQQYPAFVLDFKLETDSYDVNVTPDKRTIFLHDEKKIIESLREEFTKLFEPSRFTYSIQKLVNEDANCQGTTFTQQRLPDMDQPSWSQSTSSSWSSNNRVSPKRSTITAPMHYTQKDSESPKSLSTRLKKRLKRYEHDSTSATSSIDRSDSTGYTLTTEDADLNEADTQPLFDIPLDSSEGKLTIESSLDDPRSGQNTKNEFRSSESLPLDDSPDPFDHDSRETVVISVDPTRFKRRRETFQTQFATLYPNSTKFTTTKIVPTNQEIAEEELSRIITKEDFTKMKILGQFNLGFIIARLQKSKEGTDDLFIIDQHASDEIYNFETLQRGDTVQMQRLIAPRSLELSPAEQTLAMEHIDVIRKNGFDVQVDESLPIFERIKLTGLPNIRGITFGVKDLEDLIHQISQNGYAANKAIVRCTRLRAVYASKACRRSVMIGTALNTSKMEQIVRHLGELDKPWNCPHGRPTMRFLLDLTTLQLRDVKESREHIRCSWKGSFGKSYVF
ncbi:hypothetical protein BKA69DRAFT_1130667 [Paraphysoderma sedebokerense]|nr:hypothetical protein BKA69DRAFT_1130667 [Paraphysoderma sedebokerense]